jgi:hypothetical protein
VIIQTKYDVNLTSKLQPSAMKKYMLALHLDQQKIRHHE